MIATGGGGWLLWGIMSSQTFADLGLSTELLSAISRIGFEAPSPIQAAAIPPLLEGRDVVGQSQTGSGKTAAFAVPAIQRVDTKVRQTQVLVLCPTRELAVQVAEEVARLGSGKQGLRELPIYGGQSYERQFRGLQQGAHIVIGTPGRIIDHLDRGTLKLDSIRTVILDEADRMLDMGFLEDIQRVLGQMPEERQTVFFSATMPKPIQSLIRTFTRDPVNIQIEAATLDVPAIDQVYYEVHRRDKLDVLCRIVDLQDIKFGIVFCATKIMVDELSDHLMARGYMADKLHGDMPQAARERVMNKFRTRSIEFLVATDVAARGLDVDDIEVVFNYDLPNDGEDYVHRIGRTGRAGRAGRAITFVGGREIYKLQHILRYTKGKIRRERVPSLEEVEEKRANVFFETLRDRLEKGAFQRHDILVDRLLDQGYAPTDIASALIDLLVGDGEETSAGAKSSAGRSKKKEPTDPVPQESLQPSRLPGEKGRAKEKPFFDEPAPVARERGMTRLAFNIGKKKGVGPGDFVGLIAGAGKVPPEAIGAIHILPAKTFVDVAAKSARPLAQKLTGLKFKGRMLKVAPADAVSGE
jgi:ATP-dependent RNA helicase DeaD